MTSLILMFKILVGVAVIITIVSLITFLISKITVPKKSENMIFLGKLANTDSSITKAMVHLKLTNSIVDKNKVNGRV